MYLLINLWTLYVVFAVSVVVDRIYFGRAISTTYNFVQWNVIEGNSKIFGEQDDYWFFM